MDKWKLSFNGTDVIVEKFIFQVEHLSSTNGIHEQQLVNGLHLFLKGIAWDHYWVMLQQNSQCTWQELKASLLHRFKIRRSDIEIRQGIDNRKHKFSESFIEFYYSIHELAQPLTYPLTERELLEILKKNMRRELKIHLAGRFINSVTDLVSICTNIEDVWKNANYIPTPANHMTVPSRFRNNPSTQVHALTYDTPYFDDTPNHDIVNQNISAFQTTRQPYLQSQNINQKSTITCWNCKKNDHVWWHCDIPQKIFCFGCGLPDILLPHCPTCNREGNWKPGMGRPGFHHSQTQVWKPNQHQSPVKLNLQTEKSPLIPK